MSRRTVLAGIAAIFAAMLGRMGWVDWLGVVGIAGLVIGVVQVVAAVLCVALGIPVLLLWAVLCAFEALTKPATPKLSVTAVTE